MSQMSSCSDGTSEDLLKNIEKRRQLRQKEQLNVGWYFWLLSENPVLVIFLCATFSVVLSVIAIFFTNAPDFSEPTKGFEVRGTDLANKLVTWRNMLNQTGYNSTLSYCPYVYMRRKATVPQRKQRSDKVKNARKRKKKGKKKKKRKSERQRRSIIANSESPLPYDWDFRQNGYFCDNPNRHFSRMVYHLSSDSDLPSLWTVEAMRSICESERRLLSAPIYGQFCFRHENTTGCCPTLSLPNFVAYLDKLGTCREITGGSLDRVAALISFCAPHYCAGALGPECWDRGVNACPELPPKCVENNAAHAMLHYLMPKSAACANSSSSFNLTLNLQRTAVFMPAYSRSNFLPVYKSVFSDQKRLADGVTEIRGMQFGLKDTLFSELLYGETLYPAIAMGLVLFIILLYTGSLFVTITGCLISTSAMLIAYFLYTVVFDFGFFPFMNITAVLVMVGLSADNVLVFHSAWRSYAAEDRRKVCPGQRLGKADYPLPSRVGVVLKATMGHVAWSLFVTGFTTAAAFLANYASSVTAIKCFGMYTGLAVLTNLFLTLSWLPAAMVLHHKYLRCCTPCLSGFRTPPPVDEKRTSALTCLATRLAKISAAASDLSRVFFHQIQVLLVVRLRYFWLALYVALAAGSLYIVLRDPGLRLPDAKHYFRHFDAAHPFELYASDEAPQFAFENDATQRAPVRVIFGVRASDAGAATDPDRLGPLAFQSRFNLTARSSQRWLARFCANLRSAPFYRQAPVSERFAFCFLETFRAWMKSRPCTRSRRVCCRRQSFPYAPHVFELCLKEALYAMNARMSLDKWTAGPRFDQHDHLRALIVEIPTTQLYTTSYQEMDDFYTAVSRFLAPLLKTAPLGLHGGWFVGDFQFYSLQKGLYEGTLTSVGLSLLVAQGVILVTSRNLVIAVLANLSVACVIFVTAAALVLMGWELNVLESVTISIAVGLAVDFTLHYAIAYIVAPSSGDRQQRVEFAVSRMGAPISVAALTTFVAGAGLLPARVLAYSHFGVFLMIVMAASWIYSNYFFLPLLSVVGPQGGCGDLRCSSCCSGAALDSDEHTTVMTETSSVKVVSSTPPASSRNLVISSVSSAANTEIVERSTVI